MSLMIQEIRSDHEMKSSQLLVPTHRDLVVPRRSKMVLGLATAISVIIREVVVKVDEAIGVEHKVVVEAVATEAVERIAVLMRHILRTMVQAAWNIECRLAHAATT